MLPEPLPSLENTNHGNQPKAPFGGGDATQGFHGNLGQMFSLECFLQLCFKLELWLPLTRLSPDFRREFQWFKWKGDDVVGAQV
jgi:hypothetical protein